MAQVRMQARGRTGTKADLKEEGSCGTISFIRERWPLKGRWKNVILSSPYL